MVLRESISHLLLPQCCFDFNMMETETLVGPDDNICRWMLTLLPCFKCCIQECMLVDFWCTATFFLHSMNLTNTEGWMSSVLLWCVCVCVCVRSRKGQRYIVLFPHFAWPPTLFPAHSGHLYKWHVVLKQYFSSPKKYIEQSVCTLLMFPQAVRVSTNTPCGLTCASERGPADIWEQSSNTGVKMLSADLN